jgi:predicted secreted protein
MASAAVAAIGSAIKRNGVAIAEVINIDLSGAKLDMVDVTNMQSTGGYKEWLPTLREGGEISCTGNLTTVTALNLLQADFDAGTIQAWTFEVSNPIVATCAFNAYVMDIGVKLAHDKQAEQSFKLKITGPKVFT